jgi:hypothetical protein
MASSGMLRHVALVRTDVSEDLSASIIKVTKIGELGMLVTANVVSSSPILVTLMMEALSSSKTSVLTRATWNNIPEDTIFHVLCCFITLGFVYFSYTNYMFMEVVLIFIKVRCNGVQTGQHPY